MLNMILVRHGETLWNIEQRFQGQKDSPLSEKGIIQANLVAQELSKRNIDAIYCSDLSRAWRTAESIGKHHGLEPYSDPRLREINFGIWEGLSRDEVLTRYGELYEARYKDSINVRVPGGELPHELLERFQNFLDEKLSEHKNQTIVLVSHGAALRLIIASLLHIPIDKSYCIKQSNTGISELRFTHRDSGCLWQALTINSTGHLR